MTVRTTHLFSTLLFHGLRFFYDLYIHENVLIMHVRFWQSCHARIAPLKCIIIFILRTFRELAIFLLFTLCRTVQAPVPRQSLITAY